jgi:hypothetical protein
MPNVKQNIYFKMNKIHAGIVLKVSNLIRLLVLILLAAGCKLDSPNPVVIDNTVDIYYINSLHEDLLDTAIDGSFTADSIRLYNVVNGIKKEVNNRIDYPYNFFIYRNEQFQKYVLRVFLEVDTTLLMLNRNITDTLTCTFERSDDSFIIRKVWYNGYLKWDDYAASREFTIMK